MVDIETILKDEIKEEFEYLRGMEEGSEEYEKTVRGITQLMDRAIEMEKIRNDNDKKVKELEDDRKDRVTKNAISVAGIVVPVAVTIWGTLKSFKFEETGTVTTIMGKGFVNKLLPRK